MTIPAAVRRALGLKRGDQVKFTITKKKKTALIKPAKKFSIMSLYGSLKPKVKYKETDDIYKIIKMEEQAWPEAAVEKDRRILESRKAKQIYSFDSDFDKFPQIKRLES